MSRRAERLVDDLLSAIAARTTLTKSAGGGATLAMLRAAMLPLAEQNVSYERHIRKTGKVLKRHNKMLRALARGPEVVQPRRLVPFRPQEWRTTLTPAAGPLRNGHSLGEEYGNDHQQPGQ